MRIYKPLTQAIIKGIFPNHILNVEIDVTMKEILDSGGMDGFLDFIEGKIVRSGFLSDVSFEPCGCVSPTTEESGKVILRVQAHWSRT